MSFYEGLKSELAPSFTTFKFSTWAMYGYAISGGYEIYQIMKYRRQWDKLEAIRSKQRERMAEKRSLKSS